MAIEKVREYFKQYGMEDRILEMEQSSATVELAALAVGVEPEELRKPCRLRREKRRFL